jgi:hypothetical protein
VATWVVSKGKIKKVPDWNRAIDTKYLKAMNPKAVDPGL